MKKKSIVIMCLGLLGSVAVHAYEVKRLSGPMSDMAVRERGYHYSYCDCVAIKLKPEEIVEVLEVLKKYEGKKIRGSIKNVRKESATAAKVLRDFGKYKRINSVNSVIDMLQMQ